MAAATDFRLALAVYEKTVAGVKIDSTSTYKSHRCGWMRFGCLETSSYIKIGCQSLEEISPPLPELLILAEVHLLLETLGQSLILLLSIVLRT